MISKNVVREYNIIFDLNIDPWWRAQEFSGRTSPTRGFWGVQKYLQFLETFEQEPAWGIITNTEEELSLLTLPVFRYLHVLVVVSKIPMQYRIYYTKGKFTLWLIFLFHPSLRIISKTYGGGGGGCFKVALSDY